MDDEPKKRYLRVEYVGSDGSVGLATTEEVNLLWNDLIRAVYALTQKPEGCAIRIVYKEFAS